MGKIRKVYLEKFGKKKKNRENVMGKMSKKLEKKIIKEKNWKKGGKSENTVIRKNS